MEIIVGKTSGFCNGVSYAVNRAYKEVENDSLVYCLGELVHNERVVSELQDKGMNFVSDIEEVPDNSKMIIRAHGEVKTTYDRAKEKNLELIDLTCGRIQIIKKKIAKNKDDCFIVIIGKKKHPEALGMLSFAGSNAVIIEDSSDIDKFINMINKTNLRDVFVVSQTTFNGEKFDILVEELKKNNKFKFLVDKTICEATSNRQKETMELSSCVDVMIIVGGLKSSNTKELEVIAKSNLDNVYLVQDYHGLEDIIIDKNSKVGIMAGASTPDSIVLEIIDYLNNLED